MRFRKAMIWSTTCTMPAEQHRIYFAGCLVAWAISAKYYYMLKHRKVYIRFRFARHPSPARIYNRVADILIIFLSHFGCFDFCAIKKTYHGQRERDVWCCVVQRWPCVLGVIGWFFTSVAKINFQGSVFPGGYGIHFLTRSWIVSSYVRCGVFGLNGEKYCDSRRCSTRSNDVQRFTLLCIFNLGLSLCE